ncbi:VirB4 family type IV secretion system protein [Hydrogenivirga sp.]
MLFRQYKKRMSISPRVSRIRGAVYEITKGIELEGMDFGEIEGKAHSLAKQMHRFPIGERVKFVVVCHRTRAKMPNLHDEKKAKFWKEYEEFINKKVPILERRRFLIAEREKAGDIISAELSGEDIKLEKDKERERFNSVLAEFFGGTKEDPVWLPIEGWEYGVKIGNRWGVVLMELEVPSEVLPLHMDILNYINYEYIYCSNFVIPNPLEVEGMLSALRTMLSKQAGDPAMREVLEEIIAIQKDLELEREKLVFATNTLTIFGDSPEEALENAKNVQRLLAKNSLKFEIEGTVEYEAFLQLFKWDEKFCKDTNLVRKYVSSAFAQMMPLTMLFRGVSEPQGLFFINAGREACYIDFYHKPPPNATILGQMGAGKSVHSQNIGLSSDLIVFVEKIQEGAGSYTIFTRYFGGKYYPISLDRPLSINPFGDTIYTVDAISLLEHLGYDYKEMDEPDIILLKDIMHHEFFYAQPDTLTKEQVLEALKKYEGTEYLSFLVEEGKWKSDGWRVRYTVDRDKLSFIRTVLSLMLSLGNVEFDPAEVDEIIVATYKKIAEQTGKLYSDREIIMSDFHRTAQSLRKNQIATRFLTYTLQGSFGNFFDKPSDIEFSPTTFYEIRTNEEELLPIVIMSILTNTVKFFSKPQYSKMKKGILLDEAWLFINHPLVVKWLEEGIRTYRKKGIFLVLASQLAKDFTEGAGAFLRDNSPYKFFLFSQEHTKIKEAFELNDAEFEILKTIKRPKDYGYKYAKYYVHTPYGKGTVYFIPSRIFYWLSTTDPGDRVKREEYKKKVLSMSDSVEVKKNALYEAINLLAKEEEENM